RLLQTERAPAAVVIAGSEQDRRHAGADSPSAIVPAARIGVDRTANAPGPASAMVELALPGWQRLCARRPVPGLARGRTPRFSGVRRPRAMGLRRGLTGRGLCGSAGLH